MKRLVLLLVFTSSTMRYSLMTLLVVLGLLTGCSHKLKIKSLESTTTPIAGLSNKKIALVIDSARIKSIYQDTVQTHKFIFEEMDKPIRIAFTEKLKASTKNVTVFEDMAPLEGHDYFIYPTLDIDIVNDYWTLGCLVKFSVVARDKTQRVVAQSDNEFKKSFMSPASADKACKKAIESVFDKTTTQVLIRLANK